MNVVIDNTPVELRKQQMRSHHSRLSSMLYAPDTFDGLYAVNLHRLFYVLDPPNAKGCSDQKLSRIVGKIMCTALVREFCATFVLYHFIYSGGCAYLVSFLPLGATCVSTGLGLTWFPRKHTTSRKQQ